MSQNHDRRVDWGRASGVVETELGSEQETIKSKDCHPTRRPADTVHSRPRSPGLNALQLLSGGACQQETGQVHRGQSRPHLGEASASGR